MRLRLVLLVLHGVFNEYKLLIFCFIFLIFLFCGQMVCSGDSVAVPRCSKETAAAADVGNKLICNCTCLSCFHAFFRCIRLLFKAIAHDKSSFRYKK
jgi:hypothetical protein